MFFYVSCNLRLSFSKLPVAVAMDKVPKASLFIANLRVAARVVRKWPAGHWVQGVVTAMRLVLQSVRATETHRVLLRRLQLRPAIDALPAV